MVKVYHLKTVIILKLWWLLFPPPPPPSLALPALHRLMFLLSGIDPIF